MTRHSVSLVLVGAGKMGGALLSGWLDKGLDPAALVVLDPSPSSAIVALCARTGVRLNPPQASLAVPDVLLIALKPQVFDEAAEALADLVGARTLVLSIMAGKTLADIERRIPASRALVRAMPNTPAAVKRGISGVVAGAGVNPRQRALAQDLLSAVGAVEWLEDEGLMNAVTAVSGSGPAYVFLLAECLAAAGAAVGLAPDVADRLARATIAGAGELLALSPTVSAAELRRNVTSPGGTTAAALEPLMAPDGLASLLRRAVEAARDRGQELSG